jgi:hypothetical protein
MIRPALDALLLEEEAKSRFNRESLSVQPEPVKLKSKVFDLRLSLFFW